MKYVTIGSTFSGNKGAASILEAAIQTITAKDKQAEFTVLTVYPEEDLYFNTYGNVHIMSGKPLLLGVVINPLALLYKILPPLRPILRRQKQIRAISEADVLLDHGGISFVDGREKFLVYNVATMLPALFMGTRIVKCSQAMGPFKGRLNKLLANTILPKISVICARGEVTFGHLSELGLKNVVLSTDLAFLMEMQPKEKETAEEILRSYKFEFGEKGRTIGVLPSEVVRKKIEANGKDYIEQNVQFIEHLLEDNYSVLLMAYSARRDKNTRHNNDLLVCRDIASRIHHKGFIFIDDELSAQHLRHIISRMDMIVASRFHAMVAALSVATPPLIIGWSHKYAEVMDKFGLSEFTLGYKAFSGSILQDNFKRMSDKQRQLKVQIQQKLPEIKNNSRVQVDAIVSKR